MQNLKTALANLTTRIDSALLTQFIGTVKGDDSQQLRLKRQYRKGLPQNARHLRCWKEVMYFGSDGLQNVNASDVPLAERIEIMEALKAGYYKIFE